MCSVHNKENSGTDAPGTALDIDQERRFLGSKDAEALSFPIRTVSERGP